MCFLTSKILFILQGDYSVFVTILFSIPFCYFFVTYLLYFLSFHEKLLLSKAAVEQARRISAKFKMLTLSSLKFNQNKLKPLLQRLRQHCVKDVRKNIFIKALCGRTEIHSTFYNFFIISIQYVYITHILKIIFICNLFQIQLNELKQ